MRLFFRGKPKPESKPEPIPTNVLVLRSIQALNQKVDTLMAQLDFTSYDADVVSLKSEVAQLISVVQTGNTAAADEAANVAALLARDAEIKALRDQIAAALAPTPVVPPAA